MIVLMLVVLCDVSCSHYNVRVSMPFFTTLPIITTLTFFYNGYCNIIIIIIVI